jgi:hypothetical protein
MIASGKIIKIESENSKKNYIEIRLEKVIAICYNGESLIQPKESLSKPDFKLLDTLRIFLANLYKYKISGYVKKHDVTILIR